MVIPSDVFVWIAGILCGLVTIVIHLLLRIYTDVSKIRTEQALIKQRVNLFISQKDATYD